MAIMALINNQIIGTKYGSAQVTQILYHTGQ